MTNRRLFINHPIIFRVFFSAEFLGRSIIDFILEISRGVLRIYLGKILAGILKKGIDKSGVVC